MKYLVDANVLSEGTKPDPDPRVVAWLRQNEGEVAIDPVILGELKFSILLLPAGRPRKRLERWFEEGIERIHCVAWGRAFGHRWAHLLAELRSAGHSIPIKDSLIATTALIHGLTVVTRNVRDFKRACADVIDPFTA